jgi:hypothetical protein
MKAGAPVSNPFRLRQPGLFIFSDRYLTPELCDLKEKNNKYFIGKWSPFLKHGKPVKSVRNKHTGWFER